VATHGVSAESVMRTTAFKRGVDDKRTGRPARYDDYNFDQDESEGAATAKINGLWDYERCRQWATA